MIENKEIGNETIYIRTRPYLEEKPDERDLKGIRTSNYKYFRSQYDQNENVHLYNLKEDPYENENIAEQNKELISKFEEKIKEFEKNELSNDDDELTEEELKKISSELKKLGYM